MTFVVDIDDTLLLYPDRSCGKMGNKYRFAMPNKEEIKKLNKLESKGHTIILHTGRNWDKYNETVIQLKKFHIKYTELVMGKPQGIYIDKDSYKSLEEYFVSNK